MKQSELERLRWIEDKIDEEHTDFLVNGKVGWYLLNYCPGLLK